MHTTIRIAYVCECVSYLFFIIFFKSGIATAVQPIKSLQTLFLASTTILYDFLLFFDFLHDKFSRLFLGLFIYFSTNVKIHRNNWWICFFSTQKRLEDENRKFGTIFPEKVLFSWYFVLLETFLLPLNVWEYVFVTLYVYNLGICGIIIGFSAIKW